MTVVTVASKSVNDIVTEIDKFGRFQFVQYVLICLPLVFVSMAHVNYVFVAEEVDHRCLVPECESDEPTVALPGWWPSGLDKNCFKPVLDVAAYERNNRVCSNETFQETVEPCTLWVYEHDNSAFSTLDLGCQSWKATLVGSVHNAGMIASMLFVGWVGDKIGRKPTVIMCSVGGCVGALKVFVSNYTAYLTLEFLESLFASGLYTAGVVLPLSWLKVLFFLCGKIGVVICFTGIYTYSLELFPTSVRGSLFGVGNTAARIGSMLAPLTPLLVTKFYALPSLLFASTSLISAFLLSFTPETKTLPMFDTVAQVNASKKKITTHL